MNDALALPQSVLVLGAGSEIARAILGRLASRTTTVILGGRPGSPAVLDAQREAKAAGAATIATVPFDAEDPATVAGAVDEAFARYGDIDLVLVAFGVLGDQESFADDPMAAASAATVNYTSSVVAGLAIARHLRTQGHGTIVALSSVAGERARKANFVYGSTKAGMDAFFQGLGDSLEGSGARVVIVRPGFVRTRMTEGMKPAPFATDAAGVGDAVMRGLVKGAPIIWVPGVLRWVFVVFRHLPRRAWRRVPG